MSESNNYQDGYEVVKQDSIFGIKMMLSNLIDLHTSATHRVLHSEYSRGYFEAVCNYVKELETECPTCQARARKDKEDEK